MHHNLFEKNCIVTLASKFRMHDARMLNKVGIIKQLGVV